MDSMIECCSAMQNELMGSMLTLLFVNPFDHNDPDSPVLLALSDSGHDGYLKINYCPFCGKKVEFIQPDNEDNPFNF